MTEQDGTSGAIDVDEDEVMDLLDAQDDDAGEAVYDLDDALALDDGVVVQQFVAEELEVDDGGGRFESVAFDADVPTDVNALGYGDEDAGGFPYGVAEDEVASQDIEEDAAYKDEDEDEDDLLDVRGAAAAGLDPTAERRLRRLEAAARALADAETDRESRKVRRKVKSAGAGAGAAGLIPIVLQLVGALNLDPEQAATLSAAAASLGAFVLGWLVPEQEPPVLEASAARDLLGEADDEDDEDERPRKRRRAKAGAKRRRGSGRASSKRRAKARRG